MTPQETSARDCGVIDADQISLVLCIEANRLEPQGLMLCESIRRFGGRYANAPIVAVSPRPDLALGPEARARLRDLDVTYTEKYNGLVRELRDSIGRVRKA